MGFDRFTSDEDVLNILHLAWQQRILPSLFELADPLGLEPRVLHNKIRRLEHRGRLEQMCGCGECNASICPPGWTDGAGYPTLQPEQVIITDHEPVDAEGFCCVCGAPTGAHHWGSVPPPDGVGSSNPSTREPT